MSERQKLFYALLVSALFHLGLAVVLASWRDAHSAEIARAKPNLTQLTVTIMPQRPAIGKAPSAPATATAPTPPLMKPVLDSDGLTRSSKAPAHPVFQSDSNMIAGSLLPASGDAPLPSQAGPARKFHDFADQPASLGKGRRPAEMSKPSQAAPPTEAKAHITPEQTPDAAWQAREAATPAPTPKPRPTPAPEMIALGTPTPTPTPPQLARLDLRPPPPDMAPGARSAPPRPFSPSQPEPSTQLKTEKTRIDGGITVQGRPGVDAEETPFGRYHRKLSSLIGSRWQLYLQEHPKDVGDVTILVKLDTAGHVAGTRVLANHSMDDLAELSTRAIMESDLPPIPDDLAPMLRDGKLEITFSFDVYDPNK